MDPVIRGRQTPEEREEVRNGILLLCPTMAAKRSVRFPSGCHCWLVQQWSLIRTELLAAYSFQSPGPASMSRCHSDERSDKAISNRGPAAP
jgi:hypothetical protein